MSSVDYVNVNVEVKNLVVSQISMYIDIDRQINVSFAILFLVTSLHRDHYVLMISWTQIIYRFLNALHCTAYTAVKLCFTYIHYYTAHPIEKTGNYKYYDICFNISYTYVYLMVFTIVL